MYFSVEYVLDWCDGLGSACDQFVEQFTDLGDAVEFLHSIQYRADREWVDVDDGVEYHNYESVVDARLLFSSTAPVVESRWPDRVNYGGGPF